MYRLRAWEVLRPGFKIPVTKYQALSFSLPEVEDIDLLIVMGSPINIKDELEPGCIGKV